jgi:iron complex outermembrane receptor protein
MSGSGWTNLDAKAIYRPQGLGGKHEISFGYHQDFNKLSNSTQDVLQWQTNTTGTMSAVANGQTETKALWLQDAWRASENLQLILGGRYESWETRNGMIYNKSAPASTNASALSQPSVSDNHFSPKFSALMGLQDGSTLSLSLANAYRFPTVGELYNMASCTSSTGCSTTKYVSPTPSLIKPENVNSAELAWATQGANANHRASFFVEHVKDALISQYGALDATKPTELYQYWKNVAEVKSFGIELSSNVRKFLFDQFDVFSSLTWVESVITANEGTTSSGATVVGNRTPGVSPLRVKFVGTYRPSDKTSISLGGNYQQQFYSSIDNNDVNPNTYQGFSGFFVMDLKVRHKLDKNWVASAGIDNIGNQDYFLFHPFPQRTFVANLKYLH